MDKGSNATQTHKLTNTQNVSKFPKFKVEYCVTDAAATVLSGQMQFRMMIQMMTI